MKQSLIFAAVLSATSCAAQTIPTEVKTAFAKSFPNTTVKKWDKEDGNYEANFSKDGKTMSATFDAKGNWMETETDIKVSELPPSVISYINANYKGASVKEAAIISNPGSKKLYEAEVKGKDLLFDEQGKFLKEEKD
jgi:hypothetical protein